MITLITLFDYALKCPFSKRGRKNTMSFSTLYIMLCNVIQYIVDTALRTTGQFFRLFQGLFF